MDLFFGLVALFLHSLFFFFLLHFLFNNFFNFFILITLFYFFFSFFLFFFLHFLLSRVDDRVLALQRGVRPEPLRWARQLQDIGPPETSQLHIISNGKSSPRDLHLNVKTQFHSMTSKLQCWTPYAKKLAKQKHNPTH